MLRFKSLIKVPEQLRKQNTISFFEPCFKFYQVVIFNCFAARQSREQTKKWKTIFVLETKYIPTFSNQLNKSCSKVKVLWLLDLELYCLYIFRPKMLVSNVYKFKMKILKCISHPIFLVKRLENLLRKESIWRKVEIKWNL